MSVGETQFPRWLPEHRVSTWDALSFQISRKYCPLVTTGCMILSVFLGKLLFVEFTRSRVTKVPLKGTAEKVLGETTSSVLTGSLKFTEVTWLAQGYFSKRLSFPKDYCSSLSSVCPARWPQANGLNDRVNLLLETPVPKATATGETLTESLPQASAGRSLALLPWWYPSC